ncbi:hypothetical protein GCM10022403_092410 [Streptomyces coacervatus]|uniref:Uncharacterized protein n=1 Tax=Streptomyces coacervatus TaxID=647381 RepID=A0ABP7JKG3_9ACTN
MKQVKPLGPVPGRGEVVVKPGLHLYRRVSQERAAWPLGQGLGAERFLGQIPLRGRRQLQGREQVPVAFGQLGRELSAERAALPTARVAEDRDVALTTTHGFFEDPAV